MCAMFSDNMDWSALPLPGLYLPVWRGALADLTWTHLLFGVMQARF